MSAHRTFDRIAEAWLAEGPSELADRVLDEALAEVHLTRQRRGLLAPWRYPMNAFSRAAAAVVVAALAVAGAVYLLGRGTPSVGAPSATPSAPAVTQPPPTQLPASALVPFTSAVYGYTISVPHDWGAQIATRTLHGTEPLYGNDPQVGTPAGDSLMGSLFNEGGSVPGRLLIAAGAMPVSTTLDSWTTDTAVAKCGTPTSQVAITIDGEAATLTTYAACNGLFQQWATVIHDGWAWDIDWLNNQGSESADVVVFKQLLATFRFGQAPPASGAPASPSPS